MVVGDRDIARDDAIYPCGALVLAEALHSTISKAASSNGRTTLQDFFSK